MTSAPISDTCTAGLHTSAIAADPAQWVPRAEHERRVAELLDANAREVERRRRAEDQVRAFMAVQEALVEHLRRMESAKPAPEQTAPGP